MVSRALLSGSMKDVVQAIIRSSAFVMSCLLPPRCFADCQAVISSSGLLQRAMSPCVLTEKLGLDTAHQPEVAHGYKFHLSCTPWRPPPRNS